MFLSLDEKYPVYELQEEPNKSTVPITISKRWYKRYLALMAEYESLQNELDELWKESKLTT